jgi:hypothetical protein
LSRDCKVPLLGGCDGGKVGDEAGSVLIWLNEAGGGQRLEAGKDNKGREVVSAEWPGRG